MDTTALDVRSDPARHRYELLDGETVIGTAHWVDFEGPDGPQRIFHHTTVDDSRRGQGLASTLVRQALDDTIGAGQAVVPVCPYVKNWLGEHPDHRRHAVPVRREHLAAVPRPEQR